MEDFFKRFRDNLEQRPEPAFEEQDWQDMQKRLDQKDEKHPAGFAWYRLAMPALLLLLGSNTLVFMELQRANQKIAALETREDTVFLTQILYKTDTVYQIRMPGKRIMSRQPAGFAVAPNNFFNLQTDAPRRPRSLLSAEQQQGNSPLAQYLLQEHSGKQPGNLNNKFIIENQSVTKELQKLTITDLHPAQSPFRDLHAITVEPTVSNRKKTFRHYLYAMRPKGFLLGLAGGGAYPLGKKPDGQTGYSAGVQAAVEFSPNLRMWADVTYFNARFETDHMDSLAGVPQVDPPSGEFIFLKAEARQPSLQYSVGMQYFFNARRTLKPFIGVGFGAVSLLPYEVVYEFENQALGVEWNFDKEMNRNELQANFLLLRTGLEYQFSKHWNALFRATYRANFEKNRLYSSPMLGFEAGLTRRF